MQKAIVSNPSLSKDNYNCVCSIFFEIREKIFQNKIHQIKQVKKEKIFNDCNLKQWNNEWASVIMSFGRRTGATYWMCKKTEELLKQNQKILILTYNLQIANMIKSQIRYNVQSKDIPNERNLDIITEFQIKNRILDGPFDKGYNYVFVDPSDIIKDATKDLILSTIKADLIMFL